MQEDRASDSDDCISVTLEMDRINQLCDPANFESKRIELIQSLRQLKQAMIDAVTRVIVAYPTYQGDRILDYIVGPQTLSESLKSQLGDVGVTWTSEWDETVTERKTDWLETWNKHLAAMSNLVTGKGCKMHCDSKDCIRVNIGMVIFSAVSKCLNNRICNGASGASVSKLVYNKCTLLFERLDDYATVTMNHPELDKTNRSYGGFYDIIKMCDVIVVYDAQTLIQSNGYPWYDTFVEHSKKVYLCKIALIGNSFQAKSMYPCPDVDIHYRNRCVHCRVSHVFYSLLHRFDLDECMYIGDGIMKNYNKVYAPIPTYPQPPPQPPMYNYAYYPPNYYYPPPTWCPPSEYYNPAQSAFTPYSNTRYSAQNCTVIDTSGAHQQTSNDQHQHQHFHHLQPPQPQQPIETPTSTSLSGDAHLGESSSVEAPPKQSIDDEYRIQKRYRAQEYERDNRSSRNRYDDSHSDLDRSSRYRHVNTSRKRVKSRADKYGRDFRHKSYKSRREHAKRPRSRKTVTMENDKIQVSLHELEDGEVLDTPRRRTCRRKLRFEKSRYDSRELDVDFSHVDDLWNL